MGEVVQFFCVCGTYVGTVFFTHGLAYPMKACDCPACGTSYDSDGHPMK